MRIQVFLQGQFLWHNPWPTVVSRASTFFNATLSEKEQGLLLGAKEVKTFCLLWQFLYQLWFGSESPLKPGCSIGTVWSAHTGGAPLLSYKELIQKGRGAFDYYFAEGIIAVKWFDKCVIILSNAYGVEPLSSLTCWNKEDKAKITVPCPSVIPACNEHMGGINLLDMLMHCAKPQQRPVWYMMYKRDWSLLKEKPVPLKSFHLEVAYSLKQVNKTPSRVGCPASSSTPTVTRHHCNNPRVPTPMLDNCYDNYAHWLQRGKQRGQCNLWPKGVSKWRYEKCKVFLCLNGNQSCFVEFHQKT